MYLLKRALATTFIVAIFLIAGCTGRPSHQQETKQALLMIGLQYHNCCDGLGRPPIDRKEFLEYEDGFSALFGSADGGLGELPELEFIVIQCGTEVGRDIPNRETTILEYHKDVPEQGGFVLFANGRVELVTSEKFANLMKTPDAKDSE